MVQWLGLCPPSAGVLGSIPGQGTRSHMIQLRIHMQKKKKNSHAITKDPKYHN